MNFGFQYSFAKGPACPSGKTHLGQPCRDISALPGARPGQSRWCGSAGRGPRSGPAQAGTAARAAGAARAIEEQLRTLLPRPRLLHVAPDTALRRERSPQPLPAPTPRRPGQRRPPRPPPAVPEGPRGSRRSPGVYPLRGRPASRSARRRRCPARGGSAQEARGAAAAAAPPGPEAPFGLRAPPRGAAAPPRAPAANGPRPEGAAASGPRPERRTALNAMQAQAQQAGGKMMDVQQDPPCRDTTGN